MKKTKGKDEGGIKTTGKALLRLDEVLGSILATSASHPCPHCGKSLPGMGLRNQYDLLRFVGRLATDTVAARQVLLPLLKEFGEGPDTNGNYQVWPTIDNVPNGTPNPQWQKFQEAATEALGTEITVDVRRLRLATLEGAVIDPPAGMGALLPFIEEEEEKA